MSRTTAQLHPDVFAAPERALTPRQRAFVDSFLSNGGKQTEAARAAGYASASADAAASNLLRKPLIQSEIMKATLTAIGLSSVPALSVVRRLMEQAKSDYVKLEAAKDLLNRAGFAAPQRVDHRLDASLSVFMDLGGSKSPSTSAVTPPHEGKSRPELDLEATQLDQISSSSNLRSRVGEGARAEPEQRADLLPDVKDPTS